MIHDIANRWRQWRQDVRRRRAEELNARAATLDENGVHDLVFLHKAGFVRARATGQSITRIFGEIENLVDRPLRVNIKPGTCFVASGAFQNMVTRREHTVTVYPASTQNVSVDAACINANLPIPNDKDRFRGVRRVSDKLSRFLEATQSCDAMTVQAGVWALTDNYSGEQVKSHLVQTDRSGRRSQAVSDQNIAEAKRVLEQLGIRTRL